MSISYSTNLLTEVFTQMWEFEDKFRRKEVYRIGCKEADSLALLQYICMYTGTWVRTTQGVLSHLDCFILCLLFLSDIYTPYTYSCMHMSNTFSLQTHQVQQLG